MDYTSRPAQGAREPKTRWRHRPTPSILPRCFPPRWHAKILHAIAAQVPPKKQKPSWEGTRTRVCAPRPPRALTYRLRPCRRTRTLADTRLKTQKPQRSDASSTEQTRRLGRGLCTSPRLHSAKECTKCGKQRGKYGRTPTILQRAKTAEQIEGKHIN